MVRLFSPFAASVGIVAGALSVLAYDNSRTDNVCNRYRHRLLLLHPLIPFPDRSVSITLIHHFPPRHDIDVYSKLLGPELLRRYQLKSSWVATIIVTLLPG